MPTPEGTNGDPELGVLGLTKLDHYGPDLPPRTLDDNEPVPTEGTMTGDEIRAHGDAILERMQRPGVQSAVRAAFGREPIDEVSMGAALDDATAAEEADYREYRRAAVDATDQIRRGK